MDALSADRTVGMPAARGEIVGAHNDLPASNLAPAADMVGRREPRDSSILVIVSKAGEAADLAEATLVEQQVDALTTCRLPRRRWRATPSSFESGANRRWASACNA